MIVSGRKSYARIPDIHKLPNLIEVQLDSFEWFRKEGLAELFDEISPIESFNKGMRLYVPGDSPEAKQWNLKYWFEEPKYSIEECLERDITYSAPLYISVLLIGPEVPEPVKQDIFVGDMPLMTEKGTFIINGSERVVVSQLIRSPGVYFEAAEDRTSGHRLASAKLIPDRGAWMEFETRKSDYLIIRFNRKRTVPVTMLLRAMAAVSGNDPDAPLKTGSDEEILSLFASSDTNVDRLFIPNTIKQEPAWEGRERRTLAQEALVEFFKRMRPGDPSTLDNARQYLMEQLFDQRRYDLERVGRYKLNQKLDLHARVPLSRRTVTAWDIIKLIERLILINNNQENPDDIDHLGNRRVKTVGELIQNKMRIGLRRTERVVRERMSIRDQETLSPMNLINIRPIVAAVREFFGSSQLSQFMDQTNPLAELRHKRTLSALGPGGLRRERAGFDVRDVHQSHYGRICPIETPEGPNIGLIGRLACYAKVNPFGFIETPYRKVYKSYPAGDPRLIGRHLAEDLLKPNGKDILFKKGELITKDVASKIPAGSGEIPIVPHVSAETLYITADTEDKFIIAQANAPLDEHQEFVRGRASCRHHSRFMFATPVQIDYMDVAPRQIVGISAGLIPFLEHDDANRALMGSNMQAQAVPLIRPEVPLVSTGIEPQAALDSGQVILSDVEGQAISVESNQVIVQTGKGKKIFKLRKYTRSNQSTCIDQRPAVVKGQKIKIGDVIADSSSTELGELALGQNVVVAFMSWEGGNYEDAVLISERLVQEDKFTSIHIEKHEVESRDTKLGPEEITCDIPNVGEEALKDLDEHGIVRIGAEVGPNDILVGKITPKGEKELSPEEKLLRAIFGEKSRDVKDTSLRLPHGERGKVVDVKIFTRDEHHDLPAGVEKTVRVSVAQRRKITEGDKMAGRHGNKGVVSRIVPVEDMPYLEDGTPVDIILNPLGVPGRMNIGQILETHLGWAVSNLGFRAISPVFDGADEFEIEAELARAWMLQRTWNEMTVRAWKWAAQQGLGEENLTDDDEVRRLYLENTLPSKFYKKDMIATDTMYAKRAATMEWLKEKGFNPQTFFRFDESTPLTLTERHSADQAAIDTGLTLWMRELDVPTAGLDSDGIRKKSEETTQTKRTPSPILGKQVLFDGKTGDAFDQAVTVGVVYMLKLHHLVEDKVHARSTGPYSLVTQQPLGGKAQFGGQRFGEMEVWALEAYGAAYTLQEMLTIKSDDVQGRVKAYEAIVKGEKIEEPGIPASFRVLVKELQSLGLAVEAVTDTGDTVKFGKDEEKVRPPKIGYGLLSIGGD
jgi:DNA-directed RNA polymerase subunit beta